MAFPQGFFSARGPEQFNKSRPIFLDIRLGLMQRMRKSDLKAVQVLIVPTEGDLQCLMELSDRVVRRTPPTSGCSPKLPAGRMVDVQCETLTGASAGGTIPTQPRINIMHRINAIPIPAASPI
jgi:hypothetical protein